MDTDNKSLSPIGLPDDTKPAPAYSLEMIRCGCKGETPVTPRDAVVRIKAYLAQCFVHVSRWDALDHSSRCTSHHASFILSAFFRTNLSVKDFGSKLGWFVIHKVLNVNYTTPTEKFLSGSECLPVRLKTYHIDSFKLEFSYC